MHEQLMKERIHEKSCMKKVTKGVTCKAKSTLMQAVHQDQASYVKIQAQGDLKKFFRGRRPRTPYGNETYP